MTIVEVKTEYDLTRLIFEKHRKASFKLRAEPLSHRKKRLFELRNWIYGNREVIQQAVYQDFSKPALEVDSTEIFHVLNEIKHAIDNLDQWAKRKKIDAPFTMLGTRSFIQYEPKGTSLIISPWNYPFSLAVGPLVSALAAGNTVIIKPSEITKHVSSLLKRMVSEVFEEDIVAVVEGDAEVSKHLLSFPFDHIFFTGSPAVGKLVMKAAAENLSSVTLELGGKSPTIVTHSANFQDAAERIIVAKFINNGQTCIAPDYLLVDEKVAGRLTEKLVKEVKKRFAANGNFQTSSSYGRIVNDRHFKRLTDLLNDAIDEGAKLEFGGEADQSSRFIHPVILSNVPPKARILEEEIFGPILPIINYKDIRQAINIINAKPKPLALYLYSTNRDDQKLVLRETSAGGVCVNDSAIHFLHHNLPFGGINNSGFGKSHGHHGFLSFSNEKPVLLQKSGFTMVKLFYPPYTVTTRKIMDWFLKLF